MSSLLAQLDIDSDTDISDDSDTGRQVSQAVQPLNPSKPWQKGFRLYVDAIEAIPESMNTVQWWGVSIPTLVLPRPQAHVLYCYS